MDGIVLLIIYLIVLVFQIVLLIRCIRRPFRRRWILLYVVELLSLGTAFLLMQHFDALPGGGMMPGLTWFAEVLYSLGACAVYGGMLILSLFLGGFLLLKRRGRRALRLASLVMLVIAVIFVICALSCPTLGSTIHIGPFYFGAQQWRMCYAAYVIVMCALFIASFFVSKKK